MAADPAENAAALTTIKGVRDLWLRDLETKGLAPRTRQNYASAINDWLRRPAAYLTFVSRQQSAEALTAWLDEVQASRSVATARGYWTAMRGFYRFAQRHLDVDQDPFDHVARPTPTCIPMSPEAVLMLVSGGTEPPTQPV